MLNQIALLKHFCDTIWEYDPVTERIYVYHDTMLPNSAGQWVDYRPLFEEHLDKYVYWEDAAI